MTTRTERSHEVETSALDDELLLRRDETDRLTTSTDGGLSFPANRLWKRGAAASTPVRNWDAASLLGLAVAAACSIFVFSQLRPDLLFADTTPSGGDMGAHVWAPAFLRDHLLPAGRLSGWTPDWYAGFPAFHFYMVIPSLAIVGLNAGLPMLAAVPAALALVGAALWFGTQRGRVVRYLVPATGLALLLIPIPYGISFKLVSVSGLIAFPLAAWAMGRLARAPEPVPAFLSVASLFFLFDTNFTIYGGNIASTLAGEFAFSISLCLTMLALGLVIRGMDDGNGRVIAAVVIALVALTHVIPVFFAVTAFAALIVLGRATPRLWPLASGIALALIPVALADDASTTVTLMAFGAVAITFAAVVVAEPEVRLRAGWLAITGPIAGLLSAFWLLPFYLREPFFNDMGWERLEAVSPAILTVPMKVALPVAAIGLALSLAQRERVGLLFATTGTVFGAAVASLGEGPLWNARLLPFFYLSVYLLAAVGAALVVRFAAVAISENFSRPDQRVTMVATLVALIVGLVAVGVPLRILPFGSFHDDGTYRWLGFTSHARSFVPSWTAWNYSGYERKPAYREYRDVVTAMAGVGESHGCGRAMWEYSSDLDRYGTPMALMLLPHWTDGCIGSMEGLYFESSATTPFHFLNQSVLSQEPSRAQRDLPYLSYDIDRGVNQLQVMGVRYYMALTDESIAAARQHPDLTEIADAPPFVIFDVAGSGLVEGLAYEPMVVSGRTEEQAGGVESRFDIGWLGQAVTFYNDPGNYRSLPAEDGPADWERAVSLLPVDGEALVPATIAEVRSGTSSISFTVDQIGTPVLVKASYFPNWEVEGAEGPWRAGPNLMVVVPTATNVRLSYGRSGTDLLGVAATMIGLLGLLALAWLDRERRGSFVTVGAGSSNGPSSDFAPLGDDDDRDLDGWLTEIDRDSPLLAPDHRPDYGEHEVGSPNPENVPVSLSSTNDDGDAVAAESQTGDEAWGYGAAPADGAAPVESAAPADGAAPVESAAPADGAAPVESASGQRPPSDGQASGDGDEDDLDGLGPDPERNGNTDSDVSVQARLSTEIGPNSPSGL